MSGCCVAYTDGSCIGNPGVGGWAAIVMFPSSSSPPGGRQTVLKGSFEMTTNNRCEMTAVLEAIDFCALHGYSRVDIYTDSLYTKLGSEKWLPRWVQNDWKTSKNEKVKNIDLWQKMAASVMNQNIKFFHVKAHSGDPNNEKVDKLAREEAYAHKQRGARGHDSASAT